MNTNHDPIGDAMRTRANAAMNRALAHRRRFEEDVFVYADVRTALGLFAAIEEHRLEHGVSREEASDQITPKINEAIVGGGGVDGGAFLPIDIAAVLVGDSVGVVSPEAAKELVDWLYEPIEASQMRMLIVSRSGIERSIKRVSANDA